MDLEKLTILIVDDMQFSRETIRISMQKCGVQNIITAENALKALVAEQGLVLDDGAALDDDTLSLEDKADLVRELKKHVRSAEMVWLATDEDREGEAISWHLSKVLQAGNGTAQKTKKGKSIDLSAKVMVREEGLV